MDCSTLGLSVPNHPPKFAHIYVHCISDAIQPSHPLTPSSPSALHLSQHQRLFLMSHLCASDDQITGASASASVLPVNIQGWSPLRLTGLVSWLPKGLSGVFSSITVRRHQLFGILPSVQSSSPFCTVQLSQLYVTTGKTIALTIQTFVGRVMSLLVNTLSRFVI